MNDEKPSKIESIQISLILCLLALGSNLFLTINVVGSTYLAFGASFAFIGLLILPLRYAIPIVMSVAISFLIGDVNVTAAIVFIAEFIVLAYLRKRNIFILMASIIFWLSCGIPTMWVLSSLFSLDIVNGSLIVTLQSAFNGVLNAAIAASLFACLPKSLITTNKPTQNGLSSNIFTLCASTLVLPLLIVSFAFIYQGVHLAKQAKIDNLLNKAKLLDNATSQFIESHQNTVESIAKVISAGGIEKKYQEQMLELQKKQQTFFNITTVKPDGQLDFFAPQKYNSLIANIPDELKNIRDREYFQRARDSLSSVVSDTFLSRGVVIAPMIAIASPITNDGKFDGIVFGAINLYGISSFNEEVSLISGNEIVVLTDDKKNVVFSTEPTLFKTLEAFSYAPFESQVISEMPLMNVNRRVFLYGQTQTINNWMIFVLEPASSISTGIKNQFLMVGISFVVVLSIFLIFAYKLSNKITQPLVSLLQNEDEFPVDDLSASYTSREISDMAKKLKRSSYLVRNFENRLKLQVEEKTEQLEQLNLQLAAQAREDGLTGLYNRSGFNELAINAIKTSYRIDQSFSIVLIDIDNFKNINDTYGHPLGDECIIAFANLMQQYCKRETDIIGRYGGEEFIIFLSGPDIQSQHNIINDIHQQTRFINIVDDSSDKSISFTVSIGVCTVLSSVNLELSELINIADDELYRCKRSGRDKVSISSIGE